MVSCHSGPGIAGPAVAATAREQGGELRDQLSDRLDETPLRARSDEFELRVSELVNADAALADYVRELKRREFGDVS